MKAISVKDHPHMRFIIVAFHDMVTTAQSHFRVRLPVLQPHKHKLIVANAYTHAHVNTNTLTWTHTYARTHEDKHTLTRTHTHVSCHCNINKWWVVNASTTSPNSWLPIYGLHTSDKKEEVTNTLEKIRNL